MEVVVNQKSSLKTGISYKKYFWIIVISAFCMNVMDVGLYIPFLFIPLMFIQLIQKRFSYMFITVFVSLFSSFLLYASFLYMYKFIAIGTFIRYILFPIIMLTLGYSLVKNDIGYKKTYRYLFTVIFSFTAFGFLSFTKTILSYGSLDRVTQSFGGRYVINVWNSGIISATVVNMVLAFGLSLISTIFISSKVMPNGKKSKLLLFICFLISTYIAIQLANRTSLLIILVCFITTVLFSDRLTIKKIRNVFFILFITGVSISFFNGNVLGIRNYWYSTTLANRFEQNQLTSDPRVLAWKNGFFGLFQYPFGGRKTFLGGLSYAHNMWLDIGVDTGALPFLLMVLFTLLSLIVVIKFIKSDNQLLLKSIIVGLFVSFNLTFFVEPVIQASFTYFNIYCFIIGMVLRLNLDRKMTSLEKIVS